MKNTNPNNADLFFLPNIYLKKIKGAKYKISTDPLTEKFSLILPDNKTISDTFFEIEKREHLYNALDPSGEITGWLKEIKEKQNNYYQKNNITIIEFDVNGCCFKLFTEPSTKSAKLLIHQQIREFQEEDIYFLNPDFPLVFDGELDNQLRTLLLESGFNIPETPYKVMFNLIEK